MISASRTIKNEDGLFMRELDLELFQTIIGEQSCVVYGLDLDKTDLKDNVKKLLKKVTGGYVPIISMKLYADWHEWNLADEEAMKNTVFPQKITLKISNTHKAKPWRKVELGAHPNPKIQSLAIFMKSNQPITGNAAGTGNGEKKNLISTLKKASQKIIDIAYDSTSPAFTGWAFTASEFMKVGKCWINIEEIEATSAVLSEAEIKQIEITGKEKAIEERKILQPLIEKIKKEQADGNNQQSN